MKLANSHISYCTNIHSGESWKDHFDQLKQHIPSIKASIANDQEFGIGLRLSAQAAGELLKPDNLSAFKQWMTENNLYVFTMNGFPYGDFHLKRVKDKVHFPDWTTKERFQYTIRLIEILKSLLPEKGEGGISTSPLSYRYWFVEGTEEWDMMREQCTNHIIQIAEYLYRVEVSTGKHIHLDIEPEPDGVLEDCKEFISWYSEELLPKAISYFKDKLRLDEEQVKAIVNRYICICYDVCHFALEYEDHAQCMEDLKQEGINIGKFQVSAALKVELNDDVSDREVKNQLLRQFDEPIYLHQVIAKKSDNTLVKFRDLPDALPYIMELDHQEWRSHFHVPIFLANYGVISSTQSDILEVIALHKKNHSTNHIEVETYTWAVLPSELQAPIQDSIIRELDWLISNLK